MNYLQTLRDQRHLTGLQVVRALTSSLQPSSSQRRSMCTYLYAAGRAVTVSKAHTAIQQFMMSGQQHAASVTTHQNVMYLTPAELANANAKLDVWRLILSTFSELHTDTGFSIDLVTGRPVKCY